MSEFFLEMAKLNAGLTETCNKIAASYTRMAQQFVVRESPGLVGV